MTDEEIKQIAREAMKGISYGMPMPRSWKEIVAYAREIERRTLLAADDICEIAEREFDKAGSSQKASGAWTCKTRIRALMEQKNETPTR